MPKEIPRRTGVRLSDVRTVLCRGAVRPETAQAWARIWRLTRLVTHVLAACVLLMTPAGLPASMVIATALLVLAYAMWEEEKMWTRGSRPTPSLPVDRGSRQRPEPRPARKVAA